MIIFYLKLLGAQSLVVPNRKNAFGMINLISYAINALKPWKIALKYDSIKPSQFSIVLSAVSLQS